MIRVCRGILGFRVARCIDVEPRPLFIVRRVCGNFVYRRRLRDFSFRMIGNIFIIGLEYFSCHRGFLNFNKNGENVTKLML
jgi:hypothetical protein